MSSAAAPSLRPLWIAGLAVAVLAAHELRRSRDDAAHEDEHEQPAAPSAPTAAKAPCPSDTLPDHGVCIPVPTPEPAPTEDVGAALELLPGRPADYARYLAPISGIRASASSDGGSIIAAEAGTEVRSIRLESQIGATRWASPSRGDMLLTLHRVQRGGSTRSYVLVYRGIDFDAPRAWSDIADGALIGRVGAALEPPGLHLRVRQLRRGVEPEVEPSERTLRDSHSLECDPRNVLPLTPS